MQLDMGFLATDIERWHAMLAPAREDALPWPVRSPIGQLVKSLISGRTADPVSLAAYHRLIDRHRSPARIAALSSAEIERLIADVTFAADKAAYLSATLRRLRDEPHGFRLDYLALRPMNEALAFLETLPGVGRKVAASTLNASTLRLPVLIVDTHVWRVLRRLGAVSPAASPRAASEAVTAAMPHWTGEDFLAFHIGTKRLGQRHCRHEAPDCGGCPLRTVCPSAHSAAGR